MNEKGDRYYPNLVSFLSCIEWNFVKKEDWVLSKEKDYFLKSISKTL